jgi:putative nucleotidyltransferase with HDIG domain
MLKKIPTQQVQLGMFVQALEGSWLSHPFWKSKFLLREQADLEALLTSGVPMVTIDISKGNDVASAAVAAQAVVIDVVALESTAQPVRVIAPVRVSLAEEMAQAGQLMNRSKAAVIALFGEARMGRTVQTEECLPLVQDVVDSVARNSSALVSLARLKTKDNYTYMHSVAVCALMVSLSRQLGLDEQQTLDAGMAGLLHDIGKMAMPVDVLNKPGKLTDAEFDLIRKHPLRGHEMLKQSAGVPAVALDVCLHHHEKMDGSGYPMKLEGNKISLQARMGAVCDVYDAITSTRPYKEAWDPAGSIQRMAQWTGQFDPAVFQAFVKSIGIYPVGSLVKLESGRLAVVVDQGGGSLLAPTVRVFYSTKTRMPVRVQQLDLGDPASGDRIASRESAVDWGLKNLDDIWRKS